MPRGIGHDQLNNLNFKLDDLPSSSNTSLYKQTRISYCRNFELRRLAHTKTFRTQYSC